MRTLKVKNTEIRLCKVANEDYLCITDMCKARDGDFFVKDWLRNRNTLEFLGIWEQLNNPIFNCGEFAIIKSQSGLNSFKISVKDFVERTGAISLHAKPGRYGGTFAHRDIAFEFGMWISPEFKIYLIKEFQRLKDIEQKALGWSAKRELTKINELICLSNMESINAVLIQEGFPQQERLVRLNLIAIHQMQILSNVQYMKVTRE